MAEKSSQDKTEKATPRRRQKEKEKGNVARSMELNSVAVLFAGTLSLLFVASDFSKRVVGFMISSYRMSSTTVISPDSVPDQFSSLVKFFTGLLEPFMIMVLLVGIGINYVQVGPIFAKKALIPKLNRISPLSGFKRLFSLRSVVELSKGLVKIAIISLICYAVLKKHLSDYLLLSGMSADQVIVFVARILFELSLKVGGALLVMSVADFAYQRWEYEKNLKMTKEEVKEEMKQHEGDPRIKSRIRSIQKQIARRRMMAAIPDATVVVTNPTHLAVVLKYEPVKRDDAPVVVAKGKRKIAEKIKEIANHHGVSIVENKPLAQSLFDTCDVGMEVPITLYQAVAEILVHLYMSDPKRFAFPLGAAHA